MFEDLISFLKGKVRAYVTYNPTVDFLTNDLKFKEQEARALGWCYLATCEVYALPPGLGLAKADVNTRATSVELQSEFNRLGIGQFRTGNSRTTLSLKLQEYLSAHSGVPAARRALTPAKRDALRAEGARLLQVPQAVWSRYYGFGEDPRGNGGVRG